MKIAEEICCVCVHKPTSKERNTLKGLGCTYGYEKGSNKYCPLVIKVADQIHKEYMAWFKEQIEKLQNPYDETRLTGDVSFRSHVGFEDCRQKMLAQLAKDKDLLRGCE